MANTDQAKMAAEAVTLKKGDVLANDGAGASIQYLDCSSLFEADENSIWIRFYCDQDYFVLPVALGDTCTQIGMVPYAGKTGDEIILEKSAPRMAYYPQTGGALFSVARKSPRATDR